MKDLFYKLNQIDFILFKYILYSLLVLFVIFSFFIANSKPVKFNIWRVLDPNSNDIYIKIVFDPISKINVKLDKGLLKFKKKPILKPKVVKIAKITKKQIVKKRNITTKRTPSVKNSKKLLTKAKPSSVVKKQRIVKAKTKSFKNIKQHKIVSNVSAKTKPVAKLGFKKAKSTNSKTSAAPVFGVDDILKNLDNIKAATVAAVRAKDAKTGLGQGNVDLNTSFFSSNKGLKNVRTGTGGIGKKGEIYTPGNIKIGGNGSKSRKILENYSSKDIVLNDNRFKGEYDYNAAVQGVIGVKNKGETSYSPSVVGINRETNYKLTVSKEYKLKVFRAIRNYYGAMRYCYTRELKLADHGKLQLLTNAKLPVSFTIDKTGKIIASSIKFKVNNKVFASIVKCFKKNMEGWILPAPPKGIDYVKVQISFVLIKE